MANLHSELTLMLEGEFVIGLAAIAARLGRDKRTVSRWIQRGLLKVEKVGPFENSLLRIRADELDRFKSTFKFIS